MENFSIEWFKTHRQKEEELASSQVNETVRAYTLPYKKMKLVNSVLSVVLHNGAVITKANATIEDFYKVRLAISEAEIWKILQDLNVHEDVSKERNETERKEFLYRGAQMLSSLTDEFEVKGESVYFKGIDRSLPPLLVENLSKIVGGCESIHTDFTKDEEYISLKRFFMWCCLNPRAEVADKLYDFLVKNDFKITKQGLFVALRNVVTIPGSTDSELVNAISNYYNKVKAIWKKNPESYTLYMDVQEDYKITNDWYSPSDAGYIGNLKELYLNLPNMSENRYTDAWTHSFDIRIGKVVNMPPEKCSWSTRDCAEAGLVM